MSLLYALAGIRTPLLNKVALILTEFGNETIPLAIALLVFWCLNKKWGYRMIVAALLTMGVTMLTKVLVMMPRPWVMDPSFSAVEAAKGAAYDYSFPSGHSATSAVLFCMLALYTKKRWLKILFPCCALVVGLTRLYLGVHTPLDVCTGLAIGFVLPLVLLPIMERTDRSDRATTILHLTVAGLLVISMLIQVNKPASEKAVAEQDLATLKDTGKLLATALAMTLAHWVDRRFVRFELPSSLVAGLIRLVGGLALVMLVRIALKAVLPDTVFGCSLRYFMMVVAGAVLWPLCFPRLDKMLHTRK